MFFPSNQFSRRMLIDHKNFRFTQIPDKTNDEIFFKSTNPVFGPFLTIFWLFLPDDNSFQIIQLWHATIYRPLTSCLVSEKTNEPTLRKLTDWRKDRRKDPISQDPSGRDRGPKKTWENVCWHRSYTQTFLSFFFIFTSFNTVPLILLIRIIWIQNCKSERWLIHVG